MPMRRRILLPGRRARSLRSLMGVSVVAVLAACTTPGGATTPPTAAPTASASTSGPTATTTPTTIATTSTASDEQLAIQAVERYYAEFNKALQTRRTDAFRKTFKDGCPKCLQAANKIDGAALSGRRFEGGVTTVAQFKATEPTDKIPGRKVLRGTVSSAPIKVLDASNAIVESDTGGSTDRLFVVVRTGDAWLVWDVF
jgi:hypothetical protein